MIGNFIFICRYLFYSKVCKIKVSAFLEALGCVFIVGCERWRKSTQKATVDEKSSKIWKSRKIHILEIVGRHFFDVLPNELCRTYIYIFMLVSKRKDSLTLANIKKSCGLAPSAMRTNFRSLVEKSLYFSDRKPFIAIAFRSLVFVFPSLVIGNFLSEWVFQENHSM